MDNKISFSDSLIFSKLPFPALIIKKTSETNIEIMEYNNNFSEFFKLSQNVILSKDLISIIPDIDWFHELTDLSQVEFYIKSIDKWVDIKLENTHCDEYLVIFIDKTESRIIKAIEDNKEWKYQNIIDNLNDIFMRIDLSGTILMVSPSILSKLQYNSLFDVIGESVYDILKVDINYISEKKNFSIKVVKKDGNLYYGTAKFSQVFNGDNELVAYEGIINDITDIQNYLIQIEIQKNNFNNFFSTINDFIVISTLDGKIVDFNLYSLNCLGYKNSELLQMKYSQLYDFDNQHIVEKHFFNVDNPRERFFHLPLIKNNKEKIIVETTLWKGLWNNEECIFSLSKDLTRVEEANERFRSIYRNNAAPMTIINTETKKIISVNKSFYEALDYHKFEILGLDLSTSELLVNKEEFMEIYNHILRFKVIDNQEIFLRRKNGEIFVGLLSGEILKTSKHNELLLVIIDITKQHDLMNELEKEKERFHYAIEGTNAGVWDWNIATGETNFNEKWANLIGYTLKELSPTTIDTWTSLTYPDDLKKSEKLLQEHFQGLTDMYEVELRMRHKNGHYIWILDRGKVVERDLQNNPIRMVGTHQDVTEKKLFEENLIKEKELFSDGPVMTIVWGPNINWPVKYVSSNISKVLGYEQNQWYHKDFLYSELIHPDDRDRILSEVLNNIKNNINYYEQEYRLKKKDGQYMYVYDFTKLERDENNNLFEIRGYLFNETERKLADLKVKTLSRHLELAYESAKLGLWEFYESNNTIFVDDRLMELLEISKTDNIFSYEEWISLIYPDDLSKTLSVFKETLFEKKDFFLEFRTITKTNSLKYWRSTGKIAKDDKGWNKIIGFNLDITDMKAAEYKANQANLAKSEFLSNMSHEIRTPLNGILGFADYLAEQELPEEISEPINIIKTSGQNLLNIINDILDISKIESGFMRVSRDKFNLHEIIFEVAKTFRQNIEGKKLEFDVQVLPKNPVYLLGDSTKIKQILNNLISNSIKFTQNGFIRLYVNCTNVVGSKVVVDFEVEDSGSGINEKKQNSLFEKFEQGEHFLTKKHGGTGLGLALVKQLVDLMEGTIVVNTFIDKGTKFHISIPFEVTADNIDQTFLPTTETSNKKLKIIVAEDQLINQKLISMMFQENDFQITIVDNGSDLLKALGNSTFDLILMDIQMPLLNGLEATKIIKNNKNMAKIPIIGLSAFSLKEDIDRAISFGMDDYVTKPIVKDILLEKIIKWTK